MKPTDLLEFMRTAADFAIIETNESGKILFASPAVRTIFELEEGEVEGMKFDKLIPAVCFLDVSDFKPVPARGAIELMDDDECSVSECKYLEYLAAEVQTEGRFEAELDVKGKAKWVEISTYKLLQDTKIGFAVIINEITRRKSNEKEIRALNENLEQRVEDRTKQIKNVVVSCGSQLEQINTNYQSMKEQQMDIVESLESRVAAAIPSLNEEQFAQLQDVMRHEVIRCMDLYGQDQITDQKFLLSIMSLNELFDSSVSNDNLKPGQLGGTNQSEVDDLLDSLGI
jgi:hypothetical protein